MPRTLRDMSHQETPLQSFDPYVRPPVALTVTAPILSLEPREIVVVVVRSVERVLSLVSDSLRAAIHRELVAWRSWVTGAVDGTALRASVARLREALFRDAVNRRGSLDLAASCIAVAAQATETAGRAVDELDLAPRRALVWSARLSAERAESATRLATAAR